MLENLNGTVSEMSKNLSSRMDVLESKFESLDVQLNKRFEAVETDLKLLKESQPTVVPNDFVATSNNVELDEANSKSASWIVEEKPGSQDGLPVKRVLDVLESMPEHLTLIFVARTSRYLSSMIPRSFVSVVSDFLI